MKIIGGNFGGKGKVYTRRGWLIVDAAKGRRYAPNDVQSVQSSESRERHFGCLGFVAGAILLGLLGFMLLGPLGLMIGVVIAVAGSFYTQKHSVIELQFTDGEKVVVEGSARQANQLVRFSDS